jgi:hypothetical protein
MPVVLVIGDEYPLLLTSREHGADAIRLTSEIGKLGRKAGVSLWPVAQVPSLSEFGDQVVRSMLVDRLDGSPPSRQDYAVAPFRRPAPPVRDSS